MHYVNSKLGPSACAAWSQVKRNFALLQVWVRDFWTDWVKPKAWDAWLWMRPHFQALGEAILKAVEAATEWTRVNGPVYYDWVADKATQAYQSVQEMING
jgi:hypothetical protein